MKPDQTASPAQLCQADLRSSTPIDPAMGRQLTVAEAALVRKWRAEGKSLQHCADLLGCARETIRLHTAPALLKKKQRWSFSTLSPPFQLLNTSTFGECSSSWISQTARSTSSICYTTTRRLRSGLKVSRVTGPTLQLGSDKAAPCLRSFLRLLHTSSSGNWRRKRGGSEK